MLDVESERKKFIHAGLQVRVVYSELTKLSLCQLVKSIKKYTD